MRGEVDSDDDDDDELARRPRKARMRTTALVQPVLMRSEWG